MRLLPASREAAAARLALLVALVAVALLGWRTLASEDLGYHLAYGEELLRTGRPVDHSPEVYLVPPPGTPREALPPPGPGCRYDAEGRYRFANANWLTQAILAGVYRALGVSGLFGLRLVLVLAVFGFVAATLRRYGAGELATATSILLVACVSYPRFDLRPELLGAVVLTAQVWVLAGARARPLSRGGVGALIALQLLYVNLHGYFVLGLAVTGAVLVGTWARGGRRRLAVALAGQTAVCFVNPWTWRLALLPVETLLFLRRHELFSGPGEHPWSAMGELQRPELFPAGWWADVATLAFPVFVALVAAGLVVLVGRRKWEGVLLAGGMLALALSAQRNILVGAVVAAPLATAALGAFRPGSALGRRIGAAACVAFGLALAGGAVTGRLYEPGPVRFGPGVSRSVIPLDVAGWLSRYGVRGRVWCRLASSSNVFFFTEPHPPINTLTNTWAYPPDAMRVMADLTSGADVIPFLRFLERWDVSVLIMGQHLLLKDVVDHPQWASVYVRNGLVVLVRRDGPDARLIDAGGPPDASGADEWVRGIARRNRQPAADLIRDGALCITLGWEVPARRLLTAATRADPKRADGWFYLGLQEWFRGQRREAEGTPGFAADYRQAEAALRQSQRLRPRPATAALLRQVESAVR